MDYLVISFYRFTPLEKVEQLVKEWKKSLTLLGIKGRIYLSEDGVNAQLSVLKKDFKEFQAWLDNQPSFKEMFLKLQKHNAHAFDRLIVKLRKQLVAMDQPVDFDQQGTYLTPDQWEEALHDDDVLVIDVRNSYEYQIGHFKGAVDPGLDSFRDFPAYVEKLKTTIPKDKKILMSCTGGIRCEFFSPLLIEHGFTNVFQLKGGVIAYGNKHGNKSWEGRLFVFDDRLAVPLEEGSNPTPISSCGFCSEKSDTYYNCANMDCNALFLACPHCYQEKKGCCQEACLEAPRVRKVESSDNTPFRKWYRYFKNKEPQECGCTE